MAKATIKIATMTSVGRMALRRQPTRRPLKLSSLLNHYRTHVVSAMTQTVPRGSAGASARHACQAIEPLAPRILVRRLYDATLSGRSLGLGFVDRRFGQLGDAISGCDCVQAWPTARGQLAAALLVSDLRRRGNGPAFVGRGRAYPRVVAEGLSDGADRLGELTRDDPEGVTTSCQVRQRLQVLVGQHLGICVVAVDGLEDQVNGPGLTVGPEDRGLLVALRHQDLLLASPFGGKDLGLPFPFC